MSLVPGLIHWLALSTILFAVGIYGVLTRKNAIGVLMSIELMLNSTALNFIIFNRFTATPFLDGALMVIFIIAVAAAEAVVAMAIFVALYRSRKTIDVSQIDTLKG
ncbi:MAG: NADH-quinone oxidoreductase subunit NuoK [Candidatus Zixiibacteriota bacterium]